MNFLIRGKTKKEIGETVSYEVPNHQKQCKNEYPNPKQHNQGNLNMETNRQIKMRSVKSNIKSLKFRN